MTHFYYRIVVLRNSNYYSIFESCSTLKQIKMQGLSFASLKKHKALIPLYVCTGIGCAGALFYTIRLATRSPEVSWNKKTNPEPWEAYRNKQYKFYSPTRDYSKEESPAPKY